jgi:GNAT superfamily N-acetyltransferase
MRVTDLQPYDEAIIQQVGALLVTGFAENWPGHWTDQDSGVSEVRKSFTDSSLSLVAVDEDGSALGWIGGISQYDGHVWELHPLVVASAHQGQGIGRALVAALEARVRERGGLTITLGTDDESGQTSLSGVNLFPDPSPHIAAIRNLRRHPYEFYQLLGYVITGVVPDANGLGKPDILMAKSLAR